VTADVDLERLARERMRQTSFGQSVRLHAAQLSGFRHVDFRLALDRDKPLPLRRRVEPFPYVPPDPSRRDERCQEVYNIQVQGLTQRLASSGIHKLVVGISGGVESSPPEMPTTSLWMPLEARRCSSPRVRWTPWACRARTSSA
jgi:NAD+ synthase (glutamine-hydrolysing)